MAKFHCLKSYDSFGLTDYQQTLFSFMHMVFSSLYMSRSFPKPRKLWLHIVVKYFWSRSSVVIQISGMKSPNVRPRITSV